MALLKSISTTPLTDADLIHRYRENGNQQLLAELFLRYSDLLYGVCLKYLGDSDDARDAVMNIYHELAEKLKHHQVDNFKSWLYVLGKNHCLMVLRKKSRHPQTAFSPDMQSHDFLHPDEVLEKERQLLLMEDCIEKLNDQQQQTIRLFYLEQKCYNEICTLTGHDWNKVRSLVQNGRRNLKICMEEHGG